MQSQFRDLNRCVNSTGGVTQEILSLGCFHCHNIYGSVEAQAISSIKKERREQLPGMTTRLPEGHWQPQSGQFGC